QELRHREICTLTLVGCRGLGLVLIDRRGRSFAPASLQLLARVVTRLVVILAGGIVICGHLRSVLWFVCVVLRSSDLGGGWYVPTRPPSYHRSGPSRNAERGGIIAERTAIDNQIAHRRP